MAPSGRTGDIHWLPGVGRGQIGLWAKCVAACGAGWRVEGVPAAASIFATALTGRAYAGIGTGDEPLLALAGAAHWPCLPWLRQAA